jgi:ParB-like chromosome segregation protein Spo0J
MKLFDVPLEQIQIGTRRRIEYGDIDGLAKGIERVGLLEPIVVDRDNGHFRLVAGERRLKAVALLKWKTIPANLLENLTPAELRDIELEENENRKSLTEQERRRTFTQSKKLLENAKKAAILRHSVAKSGPGRPPKLGTPMEEIAQDLGINKRTLERAEKHVEIAKTYPWMQGNDWRRSDVLRVGERLGELAPDAREQTVAILGAAKILDPELSVKLVENLAAKKPEERLEIFELSQSRDPRQVSLALTKAAELPPMPDPRIGILDNVIRYLNAAIKPFPADPLTPQLADVRQRIRAIRAAVKEVSYDARRGPSKGAVQ